MYVMSNLSVVIPDSLARILTNTAAARSTSLDSVVLKSHLVHMIWIKAFDIPGPILVGVCLKRLFFA